MLIGTRDEFCDAAAISTAGTTAGLVVGNVIDLTGGLAIGDSTQEFPGNSDDMYLVIQIQNSLLSATGTLQLQLVSDSNVNLTTSPVVHYSTAAGLAQAGLTTGTVLAVVELPKVTYKRYLGIRQIIGTAAFTAGNVDAFLTPDPAMWRAMADGIA